MRRVLERREFKSPVWIHWIALYHIYDSIESMEYGPPEDHIGSRFSFQSTSGAIHSFFVLYGLNFKGFAKTVICTTDSVAENIYFKN